MAEEIALSVIVTVVSGREALRGCLAALQSQIEEVEAETIVPYDDWSREIGELSREFPRVRFHDDREPGEIRSRHDLYDRRRAVGLALSRGRVVAMTEDHVVPAPDWIRRILAAHGQSHAVIGGAIENGIDRPLNWAWYYCDFGRYGRPFAEGPAAYASDVNVSYKREALESVRELWKNAYHETTVHWALRARGVELWLTPEAVVFQHRPRMGLGQAYRERIEWGRVFAETRVEEIGLRHRLLFLLGTPVLPCLLLWRVWGNMRRQRRTMRQMLTALPVAFFLLTGWALGELMGYAGGSSAKARKERQG